MDDKTFELLEKFYSEFSEYRKESHQRFDKLENEVQGLKNDVIRIENNHGTKLDSLTDGYVQFT